MLFRTYEVYDICDLNMNYPELEECFICYEILCENKSKIIKLKKQNFYIKNCTCDGFIHIFCLDKWYNLNKTCPVCRQNILKNDTFFFQVVNFNQHYWIYQFVDLYFNNNILLLKKYIVSIIFLYFIINFYICVIINNVF